MHVAERQAIAGEKEVKSRQERCGQCQGTSSSAREVLARHRDTACIGPPKTVRIKTTNIKKRKESITKERLLLRVYLRVTGRMLSTDCDG